MRFLSLVTVASLVGSIASAPLAPFTSADNMAYFQGLPTEKCQWIAGNTVAFAFKWRRTPLLSWYKLIHWELDGHLLSAIGNPNLDDVTVSDADANGWHNVTATLPKTRIVRSSDGFTLRAEYDVTGINVMETGDIYVTDNDDGCTAVIPVPDAPPVAAASTASDSSLAGIGA
ncbi:hypothetical protein HKX48_009211 [Thoreauomyces humboldtii]|nr:hypothetical protein HKX48_009211 [Thoreauomyces humboldtii]